MTFAEAGTPTSGLDAPLVIPYRPRRHFLSCTPQSKRWIFACCHRRAGKTVAIANHLVRAAYLNPRQWPPPRYGYVGPSFEQAKDLVWSYLKQYTAPIEGVRFLEGELAIVPPHNGAIIKLYGGMSAYERMRGMYFDGIALDEYPLLQKTVFSTVVRPCLADYRGWAIVSGTSNGDDHFNTLRLRAEADPDRWDVFIIPLSATAEEALSYAEAKELTQDMSPDEYAREMECSFDAPVEGAYFAEQLNALSLQGRVCKVPVDLAAPVMTAWDLGVHDYCSIWWWQNVGREVHFIDYEMGVGKGLDHWASRLRSEEARGRLPVPVPPLAARHRGARNLDRQEQARDPHRIDPARRADHHRAAHPLERGRHPRLARHARLGLFRRGELQDRPRDAARLPQERDGPAGAWARAAHPRRRRLPDRRRRFPPGHRPRASMLRRGAMRRKIRGIV